MIDFGVCHFGVELDTHFRKSLCSVSISKVIRHIENAVNGFLA
jgi:hypothetical protein